MMEMIGGEEENQIPRVEVKGLISSMISLYDFVITMGHFDPNSIKSWII